MSWELIWTRPAAQDLDNLDSLVAERIVKKVEQFVETEHGDVKMLKGEVNRYRLRVGNWRVIFRWPLACPGQAKIAGMEHGRACGVLWQQASANFLLDGLTRSARSLILRVIVK